jgi:hypothetical protein
MPTSQVTNIHAGDQNTPDMTPEISNSMCSIMPFLTFSARCAHLHSAGPYATLQTTKNVRRQKWNAFTVLLVLSWLRDYFNIVVFSSVV